MMKSNYPSLAALVLLLSSISESKPVYANSGAYSLFLPLAVNMSSWQEVGPGSASGGGISNNPGGSSFSAIAVSPDGTPYVAWDDTSSSEIQIYVRRWDGSLWEEVSSGSASGGGISQVGNSYFPDIAVAPDGTPYVTWEVYEGINPGYYEIYVRRYNGSSWVEVGSGSAGLGGISDNPGASRFPSIAIAPDGTPYIAWEDSSSVGVNVYIRRWDGTNWVEVGTGSATGGGITNNVGTAYNVSIAIDPNGTPYAVWTDYSSGSDGQIYVRRWNGSVWEEVGSGSASGYGISNTTPGSYYPEIAIAPDGTPYVAWYYFLGFPTDYSFIYIRRWNGSIWEEVGTGSASGYGLISQETGFSRDPSIAITPDGTPYIVWGWYETDQGDRHIYVRRWNGVDWEEAGAGSASGSGINGTGGGNWPTITVSSDGTVYAAWTDINPFSLPGEIYVRRYSE